MVISNAATLYIEPIEPRSILAEPGSVVAWTRWFAMVCTAMHPVELLMTDE